MKLGLINSAWAQVHRDTEWGIRQTRDIGFDTIDLFADPLDLPDGEAGRLRELCHRHGLPIVSVCCVALGLIDLNPSVRRFSLDRVRRYLDFTRALNADNVLLVLGEYLWQKEVIAPSEQWGHAVDALKALGREAASKNVRIAMELEPFKLSLLNSVSEMVRFLGDVDSPAVKANIDISHLVLANEPPEALRALRGKAIHVHLSDCDGARHGDLPPGRGVVPFSPYLAEIKKLDIDGAISIELEYSPEPDRIEEWVREAYDATDQLLAEHDLRG